MMVGRIGGSLNPWVDDRGAFSIVDPSLLACSDEKEEGEPCSCKTPWDYCCETDKLPDAMALVKFVESDGSVVNHDARKVFNLVELQTVVVKGKAQRDDAGTPRARDVGVRGRPMNECFVLIGVARSRERWFSELARWSNSGVAPIEFVKCLSPDEALAVLGSGRRVSALLLDARGPGLDRELVAMARDRGVPTFAVSDGSVHRDWEALGCATVLDDQFITALESHHGRRGPGRRHGAFDGGIESSQYLHGLRDR